MNQKNKPQDNQKAEKSVEIHAEELFYKYGWYVDDNLSAMDMVSGRSVVLQNDFKSACLEIAAPLQSRIEELQADLNHCCKLYNTDVSTFKDKITELEKQNEQYR